MRGKFIAYYRVSTDKQGKSGLGLDAQRKAVVDYLDGGKWTLLDEFTEIESGKRNDRPELERALAASKFTIHILAAVAEHERDAISARTKAALAAAKANGKKLGNYRRIAEAKQRATTARAEAVRPAVTATAHLSTRAAADALNRRGIKTASGAQWHAMQVHRVRQRLGL